MDIIELGEAGFDAAVESGVSLVDFGATWCGPCKMLAALLEKQIAPRLSEDVKLFKVDVGAEPALAARLEIQSVPVLLIYRDGMLMTRLEGMQKPDDVIDAVNTVRG